MANLFLRTYTFVDGTVAYGSQVEAEIGNIVTVLNNLNTAVTNWGQVSSLHATSVPLIADCSSGSQDIADFKNNSVIKASIGSGGQLTLKPTTNQLVLGSSTTLTISSTAPASSRVATIPDPGADCTVILSKGSPTMGANLAMGSNKITGLANGTASTDAAAFGQIYYGFQAPVQATTSTGASTTSSTFQNTALTASIQPTSSSHRIKITATFAGAADSASNNALFTIKRGSTNLGGTSGFVVINSSTTTTITPVSITYIDSPATTSSTTYTVAYASGDNTHTVEFMPAGNQLAVIILEEIV